MSKESISRDRWRQLGQTRYTDWCPGCGLYAHCNSGQHRGDCTAQPTKAVAANG
jgi:hypothetical protein